MFGFNSIGYSLSKTSAYIEALCAQVNKPDPWIDVFKHLNACFVTWHNRLPGPPNTEIKVGVKEGLVLLGRAGRFVRVLAKGDPILFQSFIMTIGLGIKSGLPRPSQERVDMSVGLTTDKLFIKPNHRIPFEHQPFHLPSCVESSGGLSAEDQKTAPSGGLPQCDGNPRRRKHCSGVSGHHLRDEVTRTVQEVFRGECFGINEVKSFVFPSTSANYILSRSKGGSVPVIHSLFGEWLREFSGQFDWLLPVGQKKIRMWVEFEVDKNEIDRRCEGLSSLQLFHGECVHSGEFTEVDCLVIEDPTHLESAYLDFYKWLLPRALGEERFVEPVGLSEALKVRTITKCPGILMYVLKPLQAWMAKVLRRHDVFRLTGEPVTVQLIDQVFRDPLKDDEAYMSGDYSAATDNLFREFSEVVAEEVSLFFDGDFWGDLVLDLAALFRRGLTGFKFCTNLDDPSEGVDYRSADYAAEFEQQDGQLMGSVVSFPVLCLINASLCRYSMEIGRNTIYSLSRCPLLINGDDCLFVTTERGHQAWKGLGPLHGLSPSIGKYYYTRLFAQVNSRTFIRGEKYLYGFEVLNWRQISFIPWGLVKGKKRSEVRGTQNDSEISLIRNAGDCYTALMNEAPQCLRLKLHNLFTRNLKDACQNLGLSNIPWYLPKWFGGLGLCPTEDLRTYGIGETHLDKRLVSLQMKLNRKAPQGSISEWNTYRLVDRSIPDRFKTSEDVNVGSQSLFLFQAFAEERSSELWSDLLVNDFDFLKTLSRFWSSLQKELVHVPAAKDVWAVRPKCNPRVQLERPGEECWNRMF